MTAVTSIHIYRPQPILVECVVDTCPTCERMRKHLWTCYEWYGGTLSCAGCGDSWQDGLRAERPFARGWRRENIEHVRARLATIGVSA